MAKLIRNEENNENWPTARTFAKLVFQQWQNSIDRQIKECDTIIKKSNQTKKLMADMRTWFVNEYNLFGKPAKKAQLAQEGKIRGLENRIIQWERILELDKVKKPGKIYLSGEEKECLNNRIKVTKWKISVGKTELEELKFEAEIEKQELCLRLSYEREDLEPFLAEPENWNIREIEPPLRSIIKGKKVENAFGWYSAWWKKFNDLHPPAHNKMPLPKLRSLMAEWQKHNGGKDPEPNPYEIWVEDKTADSLTFFWIPVGQEIDGKKETYLSLLKNYLFNYYGEWYEVSDYEQINYNLIAVICQRSIFYNDYYNLITSQVSGILHHSSSRLVVREEICSCPSFDVANRFFDYGSTYKLQLKLYKINKSLTNSPTIVEDEGLKMVTVPDISLSNLEQEGETSFWESMWDSIWEGTIGTVYFLLSERLQEQAWNDEHFHQREEQENSIEWREIKSVPGKNIKCPVGTSIKEDLKKLDLDKKENEHFLEYHVKATLYWRKKQIWQGRYWIIHQNFRIQETVNPAGTSITIFASDSVIAKVTETVSMKVGGNAFVNKFIECIVDTALNDDKGQNNRQTERQVISESSKDGGKPVQKETTTKTTTKDLSPQNSQKSPKIGSTFLQPHLYAVDHTKCEYTMFQFQHRYRLSGVYPLSLRIEYNQNLLNQYRARRALKGEMTYDYFTLMTFGDFLDSPGMLKASIISTNMGVNANWFRGKIEAQVYLWENDYTEFFQKELPLSINQGSRGGTTTGSFNTKTIKTNFKSATGKDSDVGVDNMTWVMKGESFCRPVSGGRDIFPDLITDSNGRRFLKMDVPPHQSYSNSCPRISGQGICTKQCAEGGNDGGSWRFDARANWTGNKVKMPKGVQYEYRVRILNGIDAYELTAKDDECYAFITQQGATFTLQTIGTFEIKRTVGDPVGMPTDNLLPTSGITPIQRPANPFRTNDIGNPANNFRTLSGSGEPEFHVPDIDQSRDPDFDLGLDPDFGIDPEGDDDKPKDDDTPPDIPPDDDGDDPD
ncbi:MAG: hypothetical protein I3273_04930 [Candidatus Moeniiplasma glomeromycotorum]|nr:hypothetical protein [Candidatus Moeniiplasma glomeromycotorum]MCE8167886.1 hypothetical protein [Candidatus Moeniiplasma glomeromycotorum]MCE8169436.1 hypothetical protein [Candidatus Moeniiplasma glomeromycotorum]